MVCLLRWPGDGKTKQPRAGCTSAATDGWFRKWEGHCGNHQSLKINCTGLAEPQAVEGFPLGREARICSGVGFISPDLQVFERNGSILEFLGSQFPASTRCPEQCWDGNASDGFHMLTQTPEHAAWKSVTVRVALSSRPRPLVTMRPCS